MVKCCCLAFAFAFVFAFAFGRSLVALGACTFTLVSQFGFVGKADQARVAASVASGVGFIGAGVSTASRAIELLVRLCVYLRYRCCAHC